MARGRRLVGALLLVMGLVAVACSSFETAPAGEDAGVDGTSTEPDGVSPSADAEPPRDAGPTNLLANAGFEVPGCLQWHIGGSSSNPGTIRSVPNGRDGGSACLVCGAGNGPFDIYQRISDLTVTRGETYLGSAYISAPGSGKTAQTMQCAFIAYSADAGQQRQANPVPMTADYTQVECGIVVGDAGKELEFSIASMKDGVGCFLVDDARVYRQ